MQATMIEMKLTPEDCELLVELLERESADLPVEIRHTQKTEYRNALHQRMESVNRLLRQIRTSA